MLARTLSDRSMAGSERKVQKFEARQGAQCGVTSNNESSSDRACFAEIIDWLAIFSSGNRCRCRLDIILGTQLNLFWSRLL